MARLGVFNSVSLDGYFADRSGGLDWAHRRDPEWDAFVAGNAGGGGVLLLGRITYEMMVRYWPTAAAARNDAAVAEGMNRRSKIVFSRTLEKPSWANTRAIGADMVGEVRRLKAGSGPDMVILGSGSIVAQLAEAGLIDEYQLALVPVALGGGRTMFEGLARPVEMRLTQSRPFANGNVFLRYAVR